MFTMQLIFVETYHSDFNGNSYEIYNFVDPQSLTIIRGTNLSVESLEVGKMYKCTIVYKRNKLVVSDIIKAV